MPARLHPMTLTAAWWTARALRRTRRELRRRPFTDVRVSDPPRLPARSARGVSAVLRRTSPTCLERALVLQRWLAAHGVARDVIIGVKSPADGFAAHAWLDGEEHGRDYAELTRLPA
jgi:hypothetical protein